MESDELANLADKVERVDFDCGCSLEIYYFGEEVVFKFNKSFKCMELYETNGGCKAIHEALKIMTSV